MTQESSVTPQNNSGLTNDEKIGHLIDYWKQTSDVQQHFNDVSLKLRNFAVVIFSGFLTGVGLSIQKNISINIFDQSLSAGIFFALAGAFATQLVHFMDTHWYHVFLKGSVSTSKHLENEINRLLNVPKLSDEISSSSQSVCVTTLFGYIYLPIGWSSQNERKFLILRRKAVDSSLRHKIFYRWLTSIFLLIGIMSFFVTPEVKEKKTNDVNLIAISSVTENSLNKNVGFIISGMNVRVRNKPSFDAEISHLLPVGKEVRVKEANSQKTWVKIAFLDNSSEHVGWVHRDYIAQLK